MLFYYRRIQFGAVVGRQRTRGQLGAACTVVIPLHSHGRVDTVGSVLRER